MTEHNLFQEIAEDLERQKMEALWKKYGPWIVVAALLAIIGTAAFNGWESWHASHNAKATSGLVSLLNSGSSDQAKQMDALLDYAQKNGKTTQAALAQFYAANLALRQGQPDKAAHIYDMIAADSSLDPALRQYGDLLSVETQIGTGDVADLSKRLDMLAYSGAPWHFTAMEYQGYLALRTGEKAKAREVFTALAQNAEVPPTLARRANDIMHYLAE